MASEFLRIQAWHTLRVMGTLCRAAKPNASSFQHLMTNMVHGEHKKRRHVLFTDTAWEHLGDIAHEARLSNSETLERLVRSTAPWEGSATLANNAWEECMDFTKEAVDSSDLFPDESV